MMVLTPEGKCNLLPAEHCAEYASMIAAEQEATIIVNPRRELCGRLYTDPEMELGDQIFVGSSAFIARQMRKVRGVTWCAPT